MVIIRNNVNVIKLNASESQILMKTLRLLHMRRTFSITPPAPYPAKGTRGTLKKLDQQQKTNPYC